MAESSNIPTKEALLLKTAQYTRPYLLKGVKTVRRNQIWQTDITYIYLNDRWFYLMAYIDVYSRFVVGWGLFDTLDAHNSLEVLWRSITLHGKPEIINTDQGSQYVCEIWTRFLEQEEIRISMSHKGCPTQNVYIERLWRTVKYNFLFLQQYSSENELERGLGWFIDYYNYERTHTSLDNQTPDQLYKSRYFIGAERFYQYNRVENFSMNTQTITLQDHLIELYERHKLHPKQVGNYIYLHYTKSERPSIIVKIFDADTSKLTAQMLKDEYTRFAKLSKQTMCCQYRLINLNGYEAECYDLAELNIALSSTKYVQSLENYSHIELFAHNENTYAKIEAGFIDSNKVAVVQATGTGKSLLIAKLLSDKSDSQILVLAPSTYIVEEIKKHLAFISKQNISFMTYAKLARMGKKKILTLTPKLIVLDEFHRCGASEWGTAVNILLNHNTEAKVLGTSATPIRHLDGARNMADEYFESNVVQNISIAKAIAQNILPTPKYISALYSFNSDYAKLKNKIERAKVGNKTEYLKKLKELRSNWKSSSGVPLILKKHLPPSTQKILVFCKDIKHLQKVRSTISRWLYNIWDKKVNIYELHSEHNNKRVFVDFEKPKTNELDVMLVVDMLNEGIHTKGVDAIIMLRDTISPNVYFQQLGRCMSVKMDYTPIIFDFVNNFQSIRVSDFITEYKVECERTHSIRGGVVISDEKFIVIDEIKDILELYESFSNGLELWDVKFNSLVDFYQLHGHTKVPMSDSDLFVWCKNQRSCKARGIISTDRIDKLDSIDFQWSPMNAAWEWGYVRLSRYYAENGHSKVSFNDDKSLHNWCGDMRKQYKADKLSKRKIQTLEKLNFVWSHKDSLWMDSYLKLKEYHSQHCHCKVSRSQDHSLALWVRTQRFNKLTGKLSKEREALLNKFGIIWHLESHYWEEKFEQLSEFLTSNNYSELFDERKTLYDWYINQRQKNRQGKLSADRVSRIVALGLKLD